jgi:Zinc finger C-x8-C-x5-C-x3-H type (and similar)
MSDRIDIFLAGGCNVFARHCSVLVVVGPWRVTTRHINMNSEDDDTVADDDTVVDESWNPDEGSGDSDDDTATGNPHDPPVAKRNTKKQKPLVAKRSKKQKPTLVAKRSKKQKPTVKSSNPPPASSSDALPAAKDPCRVCGRPSDKAGLCHMHYGRKIKGLEKQCEKRKCKKEVVDGQRFCPEHFEVPPDDERCGVTVNGDRCVNRIDYPISGICKPHYNAKLLSIENKCDKVGCYNEAPAGARFCPDHSAVPPDDERCSVTVNGDRCVNRIEYYDLCHTHYCHMLAGIENKCDMKGCHNEAPDGELFCTEHSKMPPDDECCQVLVDGKRCVNRTLRKGIDVCKSHLELSEVPPCRVPGCQNLIVYGSGGLCNSHYRKKIKGHVFVPDTNFKPIDHDPDLSADLDSLCATSDDDTDSSDTDMPDKENTPEKHQANEHNETDKESSPKNREVDCDEDTLGDTVDKTAFQFDEDTSGDTVDKTAFQFDEDTSGDADDEAAFEVDGKYYKTYQEMVNAKQQPTQRVLEDYGFIKLSASWAVTNPCSSRTSSEKRAAKVTPVPTHKSSHVTGVTCVGLYKDDKENSAPQSNVRQNLFSIPAGPVPVCEAFQKTGRCIFGNACMFWHPPKASPHDNCRRC